MSSFREKQTIARAKIKAKRILPLLKKDQKIIDIGSGNGGVCQLLRAQIFDVTPIDVIENKSFFKGVQPIIFDGNKIPFPKNSFDVALLLTVLHHTKNPEELIVEASRVANKIIIMEDIYTNTIQKYLTFFMDSLVNWEWFKHPRTNKTDKEWKIAFGKLGLKVDEQIDHPRFFIFFRQVTYILCRIENQTASAD